MSKKNQCSSSQNISHALNKARVPHCLPYGSESLREGQVAKEVSEPSAADTPLCSLT